MQFFLSQRSLTAPEISFAGEIFSRSLDCRAIVVTRDSVMAFGAPKALRNTIHLRSDWGHFVADTLALTPEGKSTLVHELAHVWQYQNGGLAYITGSLSAQVMAWVRTGSRGGAYRWREAVEAGLSWEAWNPEQQAQAVEEHTRAWWRVRAGRGTPLDERTLALLAPCMVRLRRGEGAARFW